MAESLSTDQRRTSEALARRHGSARPEPSMPNLLHQVREWQRGMRSWSAMGPSHLHATLDFCDSLIAAYQELQALNESLMREKETGSRDRE